MRGEGPGGKSGRLFHQTTYLLLPLERLTDPLDLFGLPAAAQNDLLAEKRSDLRRIRVAAVNEELRPGWFDELTQTVLAAIVSGHGIAVCDFSKSPDWFFALGLRCCACLPAAVRWRVPVGVGFFESPAGFGFAHGQGVRGKVKVVEGRLKQADDAPLTEGMEYVEWIRPAAEQAGSVRDLIEKVDTRFARLGEPDLSRRDGLAGLRPEQSWTEAVSYVGEVVRLGAQLRPSMRRAIMSRPRRRPRRRPAGCWKGSAACSARPFNWCCASSVAGAANRASAGPCDPARTTRPRSRRPGSAPSCSD